MGPPFFFFFLIIFLISLAVTLALLASGRHVMPKIGCLLPSFAPLNFFQQKKKRVSDTNFKVLYLLHFKSIFNIPYTDLKLITYRFII